MSHSSLDSRQVVAVKAWLIEHEPGLAEEIFLDLDPHTGIRRGERWRQALKQANTRCEAVICLLSEHWQASHECAAEFRYAENLNRSGGRPDEEPQQPHSAGPPVPRPGAGHGDR